MVDQYLKMIDNKKCTFTQSCYCAVEVH